MNLQHSLIATLKKLAEDAGADLVEYALLISFVAFGATSGLMPVAKGLSNIFDRASTNLASAVGSGAPSGGSSGGSGGDDGSGKRGH